MGSRQYLLSLRQYPNKMSPNLMDMTFLFLDTVVGKVDIVLNPIFNSNFNNFRSPTKFFDITRLEAVGIYSNLKPFSEFINDNHDGILLDNNIDDWTEKISYLLDNSDVRKGYW